jgi:hypothetical protein
MSKEIFRKFIPFTIIAEGKTVDVSKELYKLLTSPMFVELNNTGNLPIETDFILLDAAQTDYKSLGCKNPAFRIAATINPKNVLAYGHFGDIKEDGAEYICHGFASSDYEIDTDTLRFALPLVSDWDDPEKRKIAMIHLVAKKKYKK